MCCHAYVQAARSWVDGDMYEENDLVSLISEQEYDSYQDS